MLKPKRIQLKDPGTRAVDLALAEFKSKALRAIKEAILQETFSDAAKRALAVSLRVQVRGGSLLITSDHPAWSSFIEGQRRQPMGWLKDLPVPIVSESGTVLFRTPTAKSLASGAWVHPGRKPAGVVKRAVAAVNQELQKSLIDSLSEQLLRSWGK